jgi:Rap1a immunity proteins
VRLAALALLLALGTPAHAGCHITLGQFWCDPNLGKLIPNFQIGVTIAPPVAVPFQPIVTAAYLVEACSSADPKRQAGCAGFISGVTDANAGTGQFCIAGIDHYFVEGRVIEYIHRVPMQGLSATRMVLEALRANWPCTVTR